MSFLTGQEWGTRKTGSQENPHIRATGPLKLLSRENTHMGRCTHQITLLLGCLECTYWTFIRTRTVEDQSGKRHTHGPRSGTLQVRFQEEEESEDLVIEWTGGSPLPATEMNNVFVTDTSSSSSGTRTGNQGNWGGTPRRIHRIYRMRTGLLRRRCPDAEQGTYGTRKTLRRQWYSLRRKLPPP
jgi:hypothetical protein